MIDNDRERELLADPKMQAAIEELKAIILEKYPSATFTVGWDEDPDGIYIDATVDVEDRTEVIDVYSDRLVDLQVFGGLPLFVVPVRTPEKDTEVERKLAAGIRQIAFP